MYVVGTPSACLLPAAQYNLSCVTALTTLTVPIRGEFPEGSPRGGTFDICPEPGVFLFGTLMEALFAYKVYPGLQPRELFVISGLEVDEGDIHVVGRIVESVRS